jgi:hypothetical protein
MLGNFNFIGLAVKVVLHGVELVLPFVRLLLIHLCFNLLADEARLPFELLHSYKNGTMLAINH